MIILAKIQLPCILTSGAWTSVQACTQVRCLAKYSSQAIFQDRKHYSQSCSLLRLFSLANLAFIPAMLPHLHSLPIRDTQGLTLRLGSQRISC